MDEHEAINYWSKEDNAYIAEAPELSGRVTREHSKALTNLKPAITALRCFVFEILILTNSFSEYA